MSKKSAKTATSRKTTRKSDAPKLVTRPGSDDLGVGADEIVADASPTVVEPVIKPLAETVAPAVESVVAAADESVEAPMVSTPAAPDHWTIARLAFAKFVSRGYVHGYHVQDWLAAEAELKATG